MTGEIELPHLLFTAPWDPIPTRRGDALGLRALTDEFADTVAPDLSNRIRDARWITVLSWCLVRSQEAFYANGGRSVQTRAQQRERYAWLRPLELMWIARTIALTEMTTQKDEKDRRDLPGQRRVRFWCNQKPKPTLFGMSADQYRAYRQTGIYGGYRLAFRKWPGMTQNGDGWTPDQATIALAAWLDQRLENPLSPPNRINNSSIQSIDQEYKWWLNRWTTYDPKGGKADLNTLPRPREEYAELPEAKLVRPLIFGPDANGKRRKGIAQAICRSKPKTHLGICENLAQTYDDSTIKLLPHFSRLADAGMDAMVFISEHMDGRDIKIDDLANHHSARSIHEKLRKAANKWNDQNPSNNSTSLRHISTADTFATTINKPSPKECLKALLRYHEEHGGGLRWFVLRGNRIEPRTPPRTNTPSYYNFRLWSLCRLARQCGVIGQMPVALLEREDYGEEEEVKGG